MTGFNINNFNSILMKGLSGVQRPAYFWVQIPIPSFLQNLTGSSTAQQLQYQQGIQGPLLNNLPFTNFNQGLGVMSFLCMAASLPGVTQTSADVRRYGYGPVQKKPFVPLFTDVTLTFIGDGQGYIWNLFQTWLKYIGNFDSRNGMSSATGIGASPNTSLASAGSIYGGGDTNTQYPYELNYIDDYSKTITINACQPTGNVFLGVNLTQAFPVQMSDVPLAWEDQNDFVKFPVTISYFDWYNNNLIIGQDTILGKTQSVTATAPASIINSQAQGTSNLN